MPRQLTAIMFTDIAGFTALMGRNEHRAMETLEKNRKIQKKQIEDYHGIWLKEMGDGILACFSSALNAVYCGNTIINQTKDDPDHQIRVAIHIGEVVFANGDVFGDGVNIASRIETAAEAGQICVSGSVAENIKNIEGISVKFIEEKEFKNVEVPVKLHSVEVEKEFPVSEPRPSLAGLKKNLQMPPLPHVAPPKQKVYSEIELAIATRILYGFSWKQMKKYFLPLFLIVVILVFAQIPIRVFDENENGAFAQIFQLAYWFFIFAPLDYGSSFVFLSAARDSEPDIKEMRVGFYYYLNVITARLLVTAIVALGLFLVIVPGIIFACRLALVPYLVVDKGLDAIKAVETSWKMTRSHARTIFWMGILILPITLAGLIVFGVGVIVSWMWIKSAFASLYVAIDQNTIEEPTPVAAAG
ncbi:MAG: adenylate/guanylate cyclase domain-containing protein [Cyclobacteriaceae bacterium]